MNNYKQNNETWRTDKSVASKSYLKELKVLHCMHTVQRNKSYGFSRQMIQSAESPVSVRKFFQRKLQCFSRLNNYEMFILTTFDAVIIT